MPEKDLYKRIEDYQKRYGQSGATIDGKFVPINFGEGFKDSSGDPMLAYTTPNEGVRLPAPQYQSPLMPDLMTHELTHAQQFKYLYDQFKKITGYDLNTVPYKQQDKFAGDWLQNLGGPEYGVHELLARKLGNERMAFKPSHVPTTAQMAPSHVPQVDTIETNWSKPYLNKQKDYSKYDESAMQKSFQEQTIKAIKDYK